MTESTLPEAHDNDLFVLLYAIEKLGGDALYGALISHGFTAGEINAATRAGALVAYITASSPASEAVRISKLGWAILAKVADPDPHTFLLGSETETFRLGAVEEEDPLAYTVEEVKEIFLKRVWELIDYWSNQTEMAFRRRVRGVVFSLLAEIDGEGDGRMPPFALIPMPDNDSQLERKTRGERYFVANDEDWLADDIAGELHNELEEYRPGKEEE